MFSVIVLFAWFVFIYLVILGLINKGLIIIFGF